MRMLRRVGLFAVLPLVVIIGAVYAWYRLDDTGRYRDALADYCRGLIPEAESAVFTDHETGRLGRDRHVTSEGGTPWESCDVGDLHLTIGDIADSLVNRGLRGGLLSSLRRDSAELPMPLGGGWEGYTDLRNTAVVMACADQKASVTVSAVPERELAGKGELRPVARQVARLVAATAVRAARHYRCDAEPGGAIPPVPQPAEESSVEKADGTCAGIPVKTVVDTGEVNWIKKTDGGGNAPVEECVLGKTVAFSSEAYQFQANYGPFAQRLRVPPGRFDDDGYSTDADSGLSPHYAWATARCPGHTARALFDVTTTEYADPTRAFLTASLKAFAEHAVKRRGCTDLRLPH